jgi:transglutaminase-like putative cysteine protease
VKLLLPLLVAGLAAAQEVPQWVREEAARPAPAYPAKVSSVVLLHEEQLTVGAEGHWTIRERGAIRLLQASRDTLQAGRSYDTKAGRIRDFHGWLLQPGGAAQAFKPQQVIDISLAGQGQTYDEARAKVLDCPNAPAGSLFAFEIVEEEKTSFTQYLYTFQEEMPVLVSRFALSLPTGWEVKDTMLNHPHVQPSVAGGLYTWELRNLPWVEREEYAPPLSRLTAHLGVTFYPSGTAAPPLKDWAAVSEWVSGFVQPAAAPSDAVRGKAGELAGIGSTLDRIRAIATFVQKVNYVSVQINVSRGGGYTPHPAGQVLARNYGDCKDKAALTKALLDAAGIESYVALAYSGDARHLHPDWPSPAQFNHAIVAIRVAKEIDLPAAAEYPRLGRLLFFDPTDPYTEPGELPEYEQGSYMLVLAGARGELVRIPKVEARANRVESEVEARLDATGALTAAMERHYYGQPAASMRATAAESEKDAVRRAFEAGLAQRIGGVTLAALDSSDRPADHRFDVKANFEAKQFGQIQGKLLLFKPGSIVPGTRYSLPARERQLPIELRASARIDRITIRLPEGFKVDEVPDSIELKSPYGFYKAEYRQSPGSLIFEQSLEESDVSAPAAEYTRLREFFSKIAGYQQAAVVMVKQ